MRHDPDMALWKGRTDSEEGELGRRWHQVIQPVSPGARPGIAVAGFRCDAGVARNMGRVGARQGPPVLRKHLANLPLHHAWPLYDAGDVECEGDRLEEAQGELAGRLTQLLAEGHLPLALGGGHELAYASFSGLAQWLRERERAPRIGIVNFDAHLDLRAGARATSGTPFRQVAEDCAARGWPFHYCCLGVSQTGNTRALFARAEALGVTLRQDEEMGALQLDACARTLTRFLEQVDHVYLTVCLDVLPAAVAPGVSAPSARGVALEVVEPLVDQVVTSGKLRLADVAELNPGLDIDERTARVAARLLARVANRWRG
jgi:formiminoglutamase